MSLWSRLCGADDEAAIDARRWIVLDVETTGLDVRRDKLLAIAAVAVHVQAHTAPRIALQDSFEARRFQSVARPLAAARRLSCRVRPCPCAGPDS